MINKYFGRLTLAAFLSVFVVMALTACGNDNDTTKSADTATAVASNAVTVATETPQVNIETEKLTLKASTPIVADWVRHVGGDRVEVESLVPPAVNPHGYQPGAKTLAEVSSADGVFLIGLAYEGLWMTKLIENNESISFTVLGDIIDVLHDEHDEHDEHDDHDEHDEDDDHDEHDEDDKHDDHDEHDEDDDHDEHDDHEGHDDHDDHEGHDHSQGNPHYWFDPMRVAKVVDLIASTLSEIDPGSAEVYSKNADEYKEMLIQLDKDIIEQINTIPEADRKIMTEHDSMIYFTKTYGLESIKSVIPRTSSETGPTPKDLKRAIEAVEEHNLKVLFVEAETNKAAAQRVAEETGLALSEELQVETLKEGQTYEEFMRNNLRIIVSSLTN